MKVMVETSARHVHVTKEDLETLFGQGFELTVKKELSQPGQFASNERVTVVGPKKTLPNVSILGPVRSATQVELSLTDARSIGIVWNIPKRADKLRLFCCNHHLWKLVRRSACRNRHC